MPRGKRTHCYTVTDGLVAPRVGQSVVYSNCFLRQIQATPDIAALKGTIDRLYCIVNGQIVAEVYWQDGTVTRCLTQNLGPTSSFGETVDRLAPGQRLA